MPEQRDPVLFYHPDGYRVARQDLKGRHSAGESFLTAFVEHFSAPSVYALCADKASADDFVQTIQTMGTARIPRTLSRGDVEGMRRQGLLHLPHPGVAEEARIRSFLGDDAYAISGITHTISSRAVIDGVADLLVAPIQPWDALICTSRSVHQALSGVLANVEEDLRARLGASQFRRPLMPVIPLGVHGSRFTRAPEDRTRWRRKIGIAEDTVAILFFGRLSVHAKASPFQLAQAAELATQKTKTPMAIIWCGWFNDDFQRRVFMNTAKSMAPSVPFYHVDGRDADTRFSIWAAADIFCSLSDNIQESFGLTVIEAMAAELPIVVSNWNGYREAVEHGNNGILVDTYLSRSALTTTAYRHISGVDSYDLYIGAMAQLCFVNVEQTADWIARLAADPALRRKFGLAARKTVETTFDWKAVMPRYTELWQEQFEMLSRARQDPVRISSSTWKPHSPEFTFAGFPSIQLSGDAVLSQGLQFSRWNDLIKQPGIVVNASVLTSRTQFQALHKLFSGDRERRVDDVLAAFPLPERDALTRTLHWAIKVGLMRVRHIRPCTY